MKLGVVKGLAYKHDYLNWAEEARKEEILNEQAQERKAQRVKDIVGNLQYGQTQTEFGQKRYNEFISGLGKELGDYTIQNPDYLYNTEKLAHIRFKQNESLNNPVLREDQSVWAEKAKLTKDLADKDLADLPEMHDQLIAFDNYSKTGDIHGRRDLRDEDREVFKYKPVSILPDDYYQKIGSGIKAAPEKWNAGGGYGVDTHASMDMLRQVAKEKLSSSDGSRIIADYRRHKEKMGDTPGDDNIIDYVANTISPYTSKELTYHKNPVGKGSSASVTSNYNPYELNYKPQTQKEGDFTDPNIGLLIPVNKQGRMQVRPSGLSLLSKSGQFSVLKSYRNQAIDFEALPEGKTFKYPNGRMATFAKGIATIDYTPELAAMKFKTQDGKEYSMFTKDLSDAQGRDLFYNDKASLEGHTGDEINENLKSSVFFDTDKNNFRTGKMKVVTWVEVMPSQSQIYDYNEASGGLRNALNVAKEAKQNDPLDLGF